MRALPYTLLFLGLVQAAEVRTWTDSQNRKIEAELVKVAGETVTLKLKDGRELPYPLAKLSAEDQKYIKENPPAAAPGATTDKPESPDVSGKLNFTDAWPERIKFTEDPEISTVEEDTEKKRFIYESANYRYTCDVRLAQSVVKGFAVMFEATHLYCRTLPLALNGGVKIKGKHQILLFEKFEDYVKAGGPPQSAGVFMGGRGVVMVPLESLGVRPVGSSYMLDRDKSSGTLPHELTHQLTPDNYFDTGSRGWFTEGIAEYVAVTPYRAGSFNVRGNQKNIFEYATSAGADGTGGRMLGTKISMPRLKTFMLLSYPDFLAQDNGYGVALLLTNYFLHIDGDGDGKRLKAFLKALHENTSGEKALEVLLDGRTFEQMEQDIIKGWGRKGVDFKFDKE